MSSLKYGLYGGALGIVSAVSLMGIFLLGDLLTLITLFTNLAVGGVSCFTVVILLIGIIYIFKDKTDEKGHMLNVLSFVGGFLLVIIPVLLVGVILYFLFL